ncbi:hypothetical protein BAE44_0004165 [Dichanthelium oligosanthes]|uniref:Uncharacterized protein n=1 Tax=Dichanthelium oligosanthes TaxID=888268 RepID=A0A1E5WBM0_9POAL|nr:hypothetical protein BAE44_0004165 [Dichanthelium oligosanthes]
MANGEARITALLFAFSALLFLLLARAVLLQPPSQQQQHRGLRGLMLAALHRFLDGRGLLDLATRTNMILLCNALLIFILRDAGVLGAPARRHRASPAVATTAAAAADAEHACSAPPRPRACRSVVVWRCQRNSAAAKHDATGRLVERQLPPRGHRTAEVVAPWAVPAVVQVGEPVATKQIVLVDKATTNHLPNDDQAATTTTAIDGNCEFDRRIIVADDERNAKTEGPAEETAEEAELADDRRIEEFIANQWSMMRQESLQLVMSGSQAIAAC